MARYKVILAYDGTHFQGFQRQAGARTVQAEVEKALRSLGWGDESLLSSGRTDTGVHASGQVIAFDLDWRHSLEALRNALNARLPEDVAAKQVEEVPGDFHPRFNAIERAYLYRIIVAETRDPLRERYAWRLWPPLEAPEALQSAAQALCGTHDFSAFGTSPVEGGSTLRHIYQAEWRENGDEWLFEVRGNAFLYHMVRRMVWAQVQVGLNRLSLADFLEAVQQARPLPPGLAPAHGLVLTGVRYAENRQEAKNWMRSLL
ncbi:tRNA pseudouridine(38-40) synthase TruA [Anaerolinea sp.]|uniref:tRNA pseudouridine(38-40) synthase TruA n=1 Tax=Anaerolinea sp. TaxID=1872519 RepID=UPI002ACDF157|nr:tRNA pseudouridine(38-40) synthase TruA [Anaerolinea sp.]